MSLLVKVCGLSTPASVDAAIAAGADMVGFVFFPRSPRYMPPRGAVALAGRAHGHAQIVALTVDATDGMLREIVAALRPDLLQLHGSETPERVAHLRAMFGVPVMKAVEERVVLLLFDTPEFAATFFGAIKIGAVPVPINTLLKPADYNYLLNDSRARVAIVSEALVPMIKAIPRQGLKFLEAILVVGTESLPGVLNFSDALAESSSTLDAVSDQQR